MEKHIITSFATGIPIADSFDKVHTEGIPHHSVAVLLFSDDTLEDVLIQQRHPELSVHPGLWTVSAGGHLDQYTTVSDCAVHHVQSELYHGNGLPISFQLHEVLGMEVPVQEQDTEKLSVFYGITNAGFTPNPAKVSDARFINTAELRRDFRKHPLLYTPTLKYALTRFDNHIARKR